MSDVKRWPGYFEQELGTVRLGADVVLASDYEAEVGRLRGLVWQAYYEPLPAGEGPELYPCLLCGYNGPGFYSPKTHPCAALKEQQP